MLVYAPAPWGGYGVAGIAGGTAGAWFLGGVAVLVVLLSSKGPVRLCTAPPAAAVHTARRIVRVGIPALIESSGMWIGNAIVLRIVGGLGHEAGPGAHIVAVRVESISFMPAFAIGTAAAVLTGQYLGLGDPERAKRAIRLSWGFAGIMMAMLRRAVHARCPSSSPAPVQAPRGLRARRRGHLHLRPGPVLLRHLPRALPGLPRRRRHQNHHDPHLRLDLLYPPPRGVDPRRIMGLGLTGVWLALCGELVIRGCLYMGRYVHGGWARVEV